MSEDTIKALTHAFITSRLDYCNSLYYGLSDGLMGRLQSVQNATTRLVMGVDRREHISPVLRQLQWLPVRRRVQSKLAILVYRSLTRTAPAYLSEECQLTTNVSSSDCHTCTVRRSHSNSGDRCFAVAGPNTWDKLPLELRKSDSDMSYNSFKRLLKTYLFD